jgi:hypothetical protein
LTEFTVSIDKGKNIASWYHWSACLLVAHSIVNNEDIFLHILKHDWLGANDAKDEDGIQQACFP